MAIFCRKHTKPTSNERAFCRALLNNENPVWEDEGVAKVRKRGFRLPPADFVYGLKHPKSDGITGVAAALQQHCTLDDDCTPCNTLQSTSIPNFIAINKTAARLGLTKVRDIHQYRQTMTKNQFKNHPCYSLHKKKDTIPDIIHGRVTGEQPSIRDLLEHRYLHEWLDKAAKRRCKEILNSKLSFKSIKMTKSSLLKQDSNMRRRNKKKKLNYIEINNN